MASNSPQQHIDMETTDVDYIQEEEEEDMVKEAHQPNATQTILTKPYVVVFNGRRSKTWKTKKLLGLI